MRLEAAYVAISRVQTSRVQVSRVQATKCPESMDPESKHSDHTSRVHLFRYAVLVTALKAVFNRSNQLYHTEYIFHSSHFPGKTKCKIDKEATGRQKFHLHSIYLHYLHTGILEIRMEHIFGVCDRICL